MVKFFVKKSSCHRFLIDWREVLTNPITKIVVPNQFPGFLLYVDNLARVLATWVKNLLLLCIKIKANFKIPLCAELVSFCCLLRVKSRQDVMHSILTNNFLLFVTTLYSKHYSQKYGNCCEEFPTRTQAYCSKFLSAQILF